MQASFWQPLKELADQLSIQSFDQGRYSARYQEQTLLLSPEQALLLQTARQSESLQHFKAQLSEQISGLDDQLLEEICQSLQQKLTKMLDAPEYVYTSVNLPLYKLGIINHLAWKLRGLMHPQIFYKWFVGCVLLLTLCYGLTLDHWQNVNLDLATAGSFYLVLILSGLIHETGHMIAAQAIERKNVQVSFGFYLFIPVLYSDLSHIWSASKQQRVIANLAGVAVETIFSLCLILVHIATGNVIWLHLALLISWSGLSNLLPVGRSDGYWVVCDLFRQPNLLPRFLPSLIDWKNGKKQTAFERFPALYGVFNLVFMLSLFFIIISEMYRLMLAFPQRIWEFTVSLLQKQPLQPLTIEDLWVVGLWFFCFRVLYMLFRFTRAFINGQKSQQQSGGLLG